MDLMKRRRNTKMFILLGVVSFSIGYFSPSTFFNNFTLVDTVTFILSILAILISSATLYLSFFYKETNFVGSILSAKEKDTKFVFECSLANAGNRELLIREITLTGGKIISEFSDCEEIPYVLKPGEIKLIKFKAPLLFIKKLSQNREEAGLHLEITANNGKTYLASKLLKLNLEHEKITLDETWITNFVINDEAIKD
jgi:hypothetical protein